jgi:hypothetical protein
MRIVLAAAASLAAVSALHAETLTKFEATPGQEVLALEPYEPPFEGAKTLNLDVGIGSAAFRDPGGSENTFYTVSDRGPNYTCDDLEGLMPVKAEVSCPEVEGIKAGAGRLYPTPDYNVSIYQVTLDPTARTFTVTNVIPLKTQSGKPVTGLTNPLKMAKTDKPRDGAGQPLTGRTRLMPRAWCASPTAASSSARRSDRHRRSVAGGRHPPTLRSGRQRGRFCGGRLPDSGSLPAIYAKRNSNRGIESLSISMTQSLCAGAEPAREPRRQSLQQRHQRTFAEARHRQGR